VRLTINGETMNVTDVNRGYARASLKKALGLTPKPVNNKEANRK
jgi:hypothetical protein